jgi:hypothetical protein
VKILFWVFVAVDVAALLFFFVLGLAAATSSRSSPLTVAAYMLVVPGLILCLAVLLFLKGSSPLARGAGLLLAAAPVLIPLTLRAKYAREIRQHMSADGTIVPFRAGPAGEIAAAIDRNDSAAVTRLATTGEVNRRGFAGTTLLMHALRRLEQAPREHGPLAALLQAGADPNLKAGGELPLVTAILESQHAGAEPVELLLRAGADPNTVDQFGEPVFFFGTGKTVPVAVLETLLAHGADLKARDRDGRTVVFHAATFANWPALLLLLERGTEYEGIRSINHETLEMMVEYHVRVFADTAGTAEVLAFFTRKAPTASPSR